MKKKLFFLASSMVLVVLGIILINASKTNESAEAADQHKEELKMVKQDEKLKTLDAFMKRYQEDKENYETPAEFLDNYKDVPDSYIVTAIAENAGYGFLIESSASEPEVHDLDGQKVKVDMLEPTTMKEIREKFNQLD